MKIVALIGRGTFVNHKIAFWVQSHRRAIMPPPPLCQPPSMKLAKGGTNAQDRKAIESSKVVGLHSEPYQTSTRSHTKGHDPAVPFPSVTTHHLMGEPWLLEPQANLMTRWAFFPKAIAMCTRR